METPAKFDLNHAIQGWRDTLRQSPAVCPGDVEELEAHLRDSIAALEEKGLDSREAFWVAANRLGTHKALQAEFGKVNFESVWIDRLLWMLTGSILLELVLRLSNSLVTLVTTGVYSLGISHTGLGPLGLILRVAIPVVLVLFLCRSGRRRDGFVWRAGQRLKASPATTAMIVIVLSLFALGLMYGTQMLAVRLLPVSDYASLMQWSFPSLGITSVFVLPLALGWLLARTREARSAGL